MKKKILVGFLVIVGLLTLTGCGKGKKIDSEITSFNYNFGSYNGGYYSYTITDDSNKVTYIATGSNGVDLNINKEIDRSYLEQLAKIINDKKIYNWNNFNKKDDGVLDGYSFGLVVSYKNGERIASNGYMKYPINYKSGHKAIVDFLNTIE